MKCYYEELGVERDASDSDIKSSYRKLALKWHPDKNLDCLEEAKQKFLLIQQAYEVLSDPQERAFYDNHREQILRGKNSEYEDNCLDVFEYFTVSCFKGYGDDEKGFYAVYREVFTKIAAEDVEFLDNEEEVLNVPQFGHSQSSYEEVVGPFYAYWQAYCTKRTYTWLCPYDIKDIRDRRVLREVEKDMKKVVQKAKKERNEEVRNLVSFVRKRDKRVAEYRLQLEERAELNRQKQEQNRIEQIRKRQRELEEMKKNNNNVYNEGYEEQLKQLVQEYGSDSDDSADDNSEAEEDMNTGAEDHNEYIDDLYCVACNKSFKNENALTNHESSKKHRENIANMRAEMMEEEQMLQEGSNRTDDEGKEQSDDNYVSDNHDISTEIGEMEINPSKSERKKKNKKGKKNISLNIQESHSNSDRDESVDTQFNDSLINGDDKNTDTSWTTKKKKIKSKKQTKRPNEQDENSLVEKPNIITKEGANIENTVQNANLTVGTDPTLNSTEQKTTKSQVPSNGTEQSANAHICVTCKANFSSKNKLFAHLKITNHGVYIPKAANVNDKDKKKAKGKKK